MKPPIQILFVTFVMVQQAASKVNFQLRGFSICNNTQGFFHFNGNMTMVNNVLRVTAEWDIKLPLDDRIGLLVLVESKVTKTLYIEVFTIREKNLCKAAHTYLGELWFSLERDVGLKEGACPIPAKKYHVNGHEIDFKVMRIQTFPYGTLRITLNLVDNLDKTRLMTCLLIEVENVRK